MARSSFARLEQPSHLFLGSFFLLGLNLGPLRPDTSIASLATGFPQPPVCSLFALGQIIPLDVGDGVFERSVLDGEGSANVDGVALGLALSGEGGLGGLDLFSARVELLELAALAGEEDEASLVVLQTSNIGDERLLGVVDTAVINGDTDGRGELLGDTSFLYDLKRTRL